MSARQDSMTVIAMPPVKILKEDISALAEKGLLEMALTAQVCIGKFQDVPPLLLNLGENTGFFGECVHLSSPLKRF